MTIDLETIDHHDARSIYFICVEKWYIPWTRDCVLSKLLVEA